MVEGNDLGSDLDEPWLIREGFSGIKVIKPRKVYRARRNNRTYCLKRTAAPELHFYQHVLPGITADLRRCVLPACEGVVQGPGNERWLIREWIEGDTFNRRWSKSRPGTAGGIAISLDRIPHLVEVVADLQRFDGPWLADARLAIETSQRLRSRADVLLNSAKEQMWLSDEEVIAAQEIMEPWIRHANENPLHLTNADFQLRNLVELRDGRIAVVDWEGARVASFATEYHTASLWLTMWNNIPWQGEWLRQAVSTLKLGRPTFRAVLLYVTLRQAICVWQSEPELRETQLGFARQCLRDVPPGADW